MTFKMLKSININYQEIQYLSGSDKPRAGPRSAVGRASDSLVRGPGFDTRFGHMVSFLLPLIQEGQLSVTGEKYVHEVLVNRLGGNPA